MVEEWVGVYDVGFENFGFLDFGNSGSLGVLNSHIFEELWEMNSNYLFLGEAEGIISAR